MRLIAIGAHLERTDIEPVALAVPLGELFISAIELAPEQPVGDRELLLRVAELRARLLEQATFIAIRYGFVFASENEAAAKCAAHLPRWRELLQSERGRVEMTLKTAAASPAVRPDRHDYASGADYLRALHRSSRAADADPEFRRAVTEQFTPLAVRLRWIHRDERSVELAILVARERVAEITRAGETLRGRFPAVPFLLSGPWPLEVFADDDQQ